jgi:hypothetical protein
MLNVNFWENSYDEIISINTSVQNIPLISMIIVIIYYYMIKSRRMRRTGHVAGTDKNVSKFSSKT